jgi:hypothetical protein
LSFIKDARIIKDMMILSLIIKFKHLFYWFYLFKVNHLNFILARAFPHVFLLVAIDIHCPPA